MNSIGGQLLATDIQNVEGMSKMVADPVSLLWQGDALGR